MSNYLAAQQAYKETGSHADFIRTMHLGSLLLASMDKEIQSPKPVSGEPQKPESDESRDEEFVFTSNRKLPFFSLASDSLLGRASIGVVGLILFLKVCVTIGW